MSTRAYVSSHRASSTAETRARVLDAAARFLREEPSIATFSLEAVAKAAGVTRLTVYNQFGSRRGLLEAVFDEIGRAGRLGRISDAVANSNPRKGLDHLVEIFCDFWSGDPALKRLHDAMATDTEFAQAVLDRNELRRHAIGSIVPRLMRGRGNASTERDAVDLIFSLTSLAMYRLLSVDRKTPHVCEILKGACRDAVKRAGVKERG
jgi:AcrR family transcriptional regulator